MKEKKLFINILVCIISFATTIITNFFIAPYITENIGEEAYGFISLATNFTNIASIATLALNSMASRFISVSIFKEEYENANKYFTSVLFANIIAILILIVPAIGCIIFLENIISIPIELMFSVKILFAITFANFFVGLINSTYSVAPFASNKVELYTIRNMESGLIKFGIMLLFFWIFGANIIIVGTASIIATIYLLLFNIHYTKKLLPFIKVDIKYFDINKIIEIIKSGIWNIITRIGQILSDGLDLLITNIFINATAMGLLSISKTISSSVSLLTSLLSNVFQPDLTKYYAKNDDRIVSEINFSMRVMSLFTNIILVGIMVFGYDFFRLWIPSSDANLLSILTIITLCSSIIGNSINVLFSIFTITNKIKLNSIVTCLHGFINIIIVYILLKLNININPIIIVASVSVVTGIIKNLTFTPIYAAKCLNAKITIFYSSIFRSIFSSVVMYIVFGLVHSLFIIDSWLKLLEGAILCGIIGLVISALILFNKEELKKLFNNIKKLFKGRMNNA